jgi:hypothetical protein
MSQVWAGPDKATWKYVAITTVSPPAAVIAVTYTCKNSDRFDVPSYFLAGVAGTWMAKSPRGDDPPVRRNPHQPMEHSPEFGRPLEFAVQPQRGLGRGCDPRCSTGALAPSLERLGHPRPYAYG